MDSQFSIDMIRYFIIEEIKNITLSAKESTTCERKGVGCSIIMIEKKLISTITKVYNGPSHPSFECTNEVGDCGCMHSEPKVIMQALKKQCLDKKYIMICTYSPCTNCANIILNSGIIKGIVYDILTEHDKRGDNFLRRQIDVLTLEDLQGLSDKTKDEVDDILRKWININ